MGRRLQPDETAHDLQDGGHELSSKVGDSKRRSFENARRGHYLESTPLQLLCLRLRRHHVQQT